MQENHLICDVCTYGSSVYIKNNPELSVTLSETEKDILIFFY